MRGDGGGGENTRAFRAVKQRKKRGEKERERGEAEKRSEEKRELV
jgi:hypothetical protein